MITLKTGVVVPVGTPPANKINSTVRVSFTTLRDSNSLNLRIIINNDCISYTKPSPRIGTPV